MARIRISLPQGKSFLLLLLCSIGALVIVLCIPVVNKSEVTIDASRLSSSFQNILLKQIKDLNDKVLSPLEIRITNIENAGKSKYPVVRDLAEKDRKRILVTGGAGFVGCHLVNTLLLAGHEVTVVDNFFTGRKSNLEQWLGHHNFELINHDVVEPLYIEALLIPHVIRIQHVKIGEVFLDQIYHLASPASPPHYMYNPIKEKGTSEDVDVKNQTIKTNSIGTLNMLGLAKRVRARLLLASTSEVYGDPEEHPQPETYWGHVNPIGPRACYDEGKRVAETMCYAYAKQEKVEVRVARIFNTYGPRMHMNDGRVVSNFILQALQNYDVTIYGDGKQTRSFQYVSDLVDGLIRLMNSDISSPVNIEKDTSQDVNVENQGNPDEHSIAEFATRIVQMIGSKSRIVYREKQQDDPQRRRPDITKAYEHLGWKPQVELMDGLNKTIEYFRKELMKSSNAKDKDL